MKRTSDKNEMYELAAQAGFTQIGDLNTEALVFRTEVRDMCSAGRCRSYGRSWTCPPYCGTIEQSAERVSGYSKGIIIQNTGDMEDDFDYETIQSAGEDFKKYLNRLTELLRERDIDHYALGAGTCGYCGSCTCPDEPCRFPDRAISSMEASGLVVSDVCTASGVQYNYGQRTITYTGCVLYK